MSVEPCGSTKAPCLKEELRELLWGNTGACLLSEVGSWSRCKCIDSVFFVVLALLLQLLVPIVSG
jgi:hypothetical protein